MHDEQGNEAGLRVWQLAAVLLCGCAVILSRRPDLIYHPQFYAEDGHVWFADAYNLGWGHALFRTWSGYFLTLPRLGAALALLVPLNRVPLVLNVIAILFQALPVCILLSARSSVWGSLRFRVTLAVIYLALPNCDEVTRSITDANWPLALSAFLLLMGEVPRSRAGRIFDVVVLTLCGLTGPFCIFLLPIAMLQAWRNREIWRLVLVAIFAGCSTIQCFALKFLAPASRAHRELGASVGLLARILGGQVYLGALLGSNGLSAVPGRAILMVLVCVAVSGTAVAFICVRRSPMAMKLFVVFTAVVFAAGLMNPFEWDHPTVPVWMVYAGIPGLRYWFFPTLVFAWLLVWGVRSHSSPVRILSAALLCLMCVGIFRDWRHPAFPETHLAESVARFNAAQAGTTVTVQEYPIGWTMQLVKHPSRQ